MAPPTLTQGKALADKANVAAIMSSGWQHAMALHYSFEHPGTQPDVTKSYFTVPKGNMPVGNDMALVLSDACQSSGERPRTLYQAGDDSTIKVYRSSREGKVIGKTKKGGDCTITCVILMSKGQGVVIKTAYPVAVIPDDDVPLK